MVDLILTTFDWVPETPRGHVRDIRVRWALEEAGLPYRVESVPFRARNAEHFSHQAFWPGAVVDGWRHLDLRERRDPAHLGELSDKLMPRIGAGAATPRNGCSQRSLLSRPRASLGPSSCSQVTPTKRQCEGFLTPSLRPGSSTWKRSWTEANGWSGPSP